MKKKKEDLLTAKEARKLVNDKRNASYKRNLNEVLRAIKDHATWGHESINLDATLVNKKVIETLEELGYELKFNTEWTLVVSW